MTRTPPLVWGLLAVSVLGVSSAGAILSHLDSIPPLMRGSWRLQITVLLLLPFAIWQYRKKQRAYLVAMVLKKSSLSALVFSSEIKKGSSAGKPSPAFRTLARAKTQHISPELLLQTPNKQELIICSRRGRSRR